MVLHRLIQRRGGDPASHLPTSLQLEDLCCHRGVNITSTPQDLVLLTCHTSTHPLTAPEVLPGNLLG